MTVLALVLSIALSSFGSGSTAMQPTPPAERLVIALGRGELAWQLSEPAEVQAVLGKPLSDETERDGGMEVRVWTYSPGFVVAFARQFGTNAPFTLFQARDGGRQMGLQPGERLTLRTTADLDKVRPFTGVQNVDLSRLDLRNEGIRLRQLSFDTRTVWPAATRMPVGFDPVALLEAGKNPGLGVRALHAQGIDGRGVTIGIIDQPLLPDHSEIAGGRLQLVAELDVAGVAPQMHGPAVSSLAAGRSIGVAPAARVAYVSMAMWKAAKDNSLYIEALQRVLDFNRDKATKDRIRVVSISYGGFGGGARAEEWRTLVTRAGAEGVLVITCDLAQTELDYGMLKPVPGADRDKPEGWQKGTYGKTTLLVPADGRTYARHEGVNDYVYGPEGGLSWAPPYIAGVAALGYQVNPDLTPAQIRAYLLASATPMPFGAVVNPKAFVEMCAKKTTGRIRPQP